jgi:hypothetical protein
MPCAIMIEPAFATLVVDALPPRAAGRMCSIDDRCRTGTPQVAM